MSIGGKATGNGVSTCPRLGRRLSGSAPECLDRGSPQELKPVSSTNSATSAVASLAIGTWRASPQRDRHEFRRRPLHGFRLSPFEDFPGFFETPLTSLSPHTGTTRSPDGAAPPTGS